MSHKFNNIEKVYFDDGEAGKIGDAFIFNMTFSQSYSSGPSSLSIQAISEDGNYASVPAPNFDNVYVVKIGNKIVFRGYILSKEISTSVQDKSLSITMVDKSLILDQYGIGLVNRHGNVATQKTSISNIKVRRQDPLSDGQSTETTVSVERDIANTEVTGVKLINNVFIIGREKYTSNKCEIPDVEYFGSHFSAAINAFSSISGISFSSLPPILSGRNYTGTIREVLNSLCSDAGMSFYYDSSNDKIEIFSLNSKSIDDSIIEELKNDENITINSFNESESLEGTFANFFSVREMRPGRGGVSEQNLECATSFINSPAFRGPSGLPNIFYIDRAAILGKVSPSLRSRYCYEAAQYERIGWTNVSHLWDQSSIIDPDLISNTPGGTSVDRFSNFIGLAQEEVRQFIRNNPQLQNGFNLYAVNLNDRLKEDYEVQELSSLGAWGPYYEAIFDPMSVMINTPAATSCNVKNITQEPQPQWYEVEGYGFWGFKGEESWEFNNLDMDKFSADTSIALMDITAPVQEAVNGGFYGNQISSQTVLAFVPRGNYVGSISNEEWKPSKWSQDFLGDYFNSGYDDENCVPYMIVRIAGKTKTSPCGATPCTDATIERAFDGITTSQCSTERLPTGEVCQRKRYGISVNLQGIGTLIVGGPWISNTGYRSNIITQYVRNKSTEISRSINIINGAHGLHTNNFAKLNINDIDATAEIFDPKSSNSNYITPQTINTTLGSTFDSASAIFSSFTEGSSVNGLPRSISLQIDGIPSNLDKSLNSKDIKDWNINFGPEGISMNLNYADAPSTPPSMDYLQSRLHNQFHYTTILGQ